MMTLFLCLRLHDKVSNFEAYLIKIFFLNCLLIFDSGWPFFVDLNCFFGNISLMRFDNKNCQVIEK